MKAVVEAKDRGFVLEKDLVKEIDRKKVHSLVTTFNNQIYLIQSLITTG